MGRTLDRDWVALALVISLVACDDVAGGLDAAPVDAARPVDAGAAVSTIVSQSPASSYESESHIAVGANGRIVIAWIAFGAMQPSPRVAYSASLDDGTTWSAPRAPPVADGRASADPVLAVDSDDRFFFAWLDYAPAANSDPNDARVLVAEIDPVSGDTTTPIEVSDAADANRHLDKPWLLATADDTLVVAWTDVASGALWASTSRDRGESFAATTLPATTTRHGLVYLCSDPATIAAPVFLLAWTSSSIEVFRSPDAASWQPPTADPTGPGTAVAQMPACVTRGDDLWVGFASGFSNGIGGPVQRPGNEILVARAVDPDTGFAPAVTASGALPAVGFYDHLGPAMLQRADRTLDLVYFFGDEGEPLTLARATSNDDGVSFSHSTAAALGTYTNSRSASHWLGDYLGVAIRGEQLYVAFPDNETDPGRSHIRFLRTPL